MSRFARFRPPRERVWVRRSGHLGGDARPVTLKSGRERARRRTSGRTRPSARSQSARPGGPPPPPRTARRGATRAGREASLLFARATPPRVRAEWRRSTSSTPSIYARRDADEQIARVLRETVVFATRARATATARLRLITKRQACADVILPTGTGELLCASRQYCRIFRRWEIFCFDPNPVSYRSDTDRAIGDRF